MCFEGVESKRKNYKMFFFFLNTFCRWDSSEVNLNKYNYISLNK